MPTATNSALAPTLFHSRVNCICLSQDPTWCWWHHRHRSPALWPCTSLAQGVGQGLQGNFTLRATLHPVSLGAPKMGEQGLHGTLHLRRHPRPVDRLLRARAVATPCAEPLLCCVFRPRHTRKDTNSVPCVRPSPSGVATAWRAGRDARASSSSRGRPPPGSGRAPYRVITVSISVRYVEGGSVASFRFRRFVVWSLPLTHVAKEERDDGNQLQRGPFPAGYYSDGYPLVCRLPVVTHKRNPSDPQISPRCGSHWLQMGRASDPHCVQMGPHWVQTAHKHPRGPTLGATRLLGSF
jgi:hypothetical protein